MYSNRDMASIPKYKNEAFLETDVARDVYERIQYLTCESCDKDIHDILLFPNTRDVSLGAYCYSCSALVTEPIPGRDKVFFRVMAYSYERMKQDFERFISTNNYIFRNMGHDFLFKHYNAYHNAMRYCDGCNSKTKRIIIGSHLGSVFSTPICDVCGPHYNQESPKFVVDYPVTKELLRVLLVHEA